MKKILFLIISILIPFLLNAQFYNYINKAELCIIKDDYAGAMEQYLMVTKEYKHASSNDYYNLVLCATLLDNKPVAQQYFDSCLTSGYKLKNFKGTVIKQFLGLKELNNERSKQIDSLIKTYENLKNKDKFYALNKLVINDQKACGIRNVDPYMVDSVFYAHGKRLVHLIKSDSIPKKELFNFVENRGFGSYVPWVLIRHYFGMVNRAKRYLSKDDTHKEFYNMVVNDSSLFLCLNKLIQTGYFSPIFFRDGLVYNQEFEQFGFTGERVYILYNKDGSNIVNELSFVEGDYTKNEIDLFNKNRKAIGLMSYEEEMDVVNYWKNFDKNNKTKEKKFNLNYTIPYDYHQNSSENMRFKIGRKQIRIQRRQKKWGWKDEKIIRKQNIVFIE